MHATHRDLQNGNDLFLLERRGDFSAVYYDLTNPGRTVLQDQFVAPAWVSDDKSRMI